MAALAHDERHKAQREPRRDEALRTLSERQPVDPAPRAQARREIAEQEQDPERKHHTQPVRVGEREAEGAPDEERVLGRRDIEDSAEDREVEHRGGRRDQRREPGEPGHALASRDPVGEHDAEDGRGRQDRDLRERRQMTPDPVEAEEHRRGQRQGAEQRGDRHAPRQPPLLERGIDIEARGELSPQPVVMRLERATLLGREREHALGLQRRELGDERLRAVKPRLGLAPAVDLRAGLWAGHAGAGVLSSGRAPVDSRLCWKARLRCLEPLELIKPPPPFQARAAPGASARPADATAPSRVLRPSGNAGRTRRTRAGWSARRRRAPRAR